MAIYGTTPITGVNLQDIWSAGSGYTAYNDYPPFAIGQQAMGTLDSLWVYTVVDTGATLAYGNVVMLDPLTGKAKPIIGGAASEATKFTVAFYQNTTSATAGQGCWVMLSGVPTITVSGAPVKMVTLYTTDTSGVLDDAVATGSQYPVRGVVMLTTVSGATATTGAARVQSPSIGPIGALT